jgi:adenylate cyclase
MASATRTAYRFTDFTLDLDYGSVERAGTVRDLRPKTLEVLRVLVEHAGRLVTKDELMAAVWPRIFVTEDSLTRCISEARAALRDDAQTIIKTVPRRGYIFTSRVIAEGSDAGGSVLPSTATVDGDPGPTPTPAPARRSQRRWVIAAVMIALIALIGGLLLRPSSHLATAGRPSIAVLPFQTIGGGQEHVADGISEDLTTSLSKFGELLVIADSSSATYKGKSIGTGEVGRELGVRYVVQGSVRSDAERIRISVQLIEAATGISLWGQHYDRETVAIFAIQDDVTQKIAGTLVAHLSQAELQRAQSKAPRTLAAYDHYLQGRAAIKHVYRQPNRGETIAAARALFEKSLAVDPRYAPAVQALAFTYALAYLEPAASEPIRLEYDQQDTIDRAFVLAQRAIDLDANLAEAHATLGWILHWLYRRSESIAEFERAFDLNPNLADGRFALVLTHNGRAEEGIAYMKRIMRLDPFHTPVYFTWLGNAYYLNGSYKDAFEHLMAASSRLPGHRPTKVWLAAAAARIGEAGVAQQAVTDVVKAQPGFTIGKWLSLLKLASAADADNLAEGMRKAGFPQ